jgi:hypothetical protein
MSNGFFPPGGELTAAQEEAVDSIINAPQDTLLRGDNGKVAGSSFIQLPDETIETQKIVRSGTNNAYEIALAHTISSGGAFLSFLNTEEGVYKRAIAQEYGVGRESIIVPFSFASVSLPIETVFSDELTNPVWTVVVPQVIDEDGQTATFADVKFAATSTLTNVVLDVTVNGTFQIRLNVGTITVGDFNFEYEPPFDFKVGDTIQFAISSEDGDVVMLGNNVSGIPFVTQDVNLWKNTQLSFRKDFVPKYVNSASSVEDRTAQNAQVYAADGTAGAFTITADADAEFFSVFDFAGNWNAGARKITVVIGLDSYELTQRKRNYFFYKDEGGTWQWYFSNYRSGS